MMPEPADIDRVLDQIEEALICGDLIRALANIDHFDPSVRLHNERLRELVHRVRVAQEDEDRTHIMLDQAIHLLENDDPDQALLLFQTIVDAFPDNREARAGIQEARRHLEHRHLVNILIQHVRESREAGDLNATREYCREWLQLEPGDETAVDILGSVEKSLTREREVRVLLHRGEELITRELYEEAIDVLDKIPDMDPGNTGALELIQVAMNHIQQTRNDSAVRSAVEEASRWIDRGHFRMAMDKLESIEASNSNGELRTDIAMLRRKAREGLLDRETEADLTEKLHVAVSRKNFHEARTWLGMIAEINPLSTIYDVLKRELSPDEYEDLTG
ncbi:hypothetical protein JXA80_05160 [bacterium]|nr:hypothetical protein [candidate division CSSED10-310 bacterium]